MSQLTPNSRHFTSLLEALKQEGAAGTSADPEFTPTEEVEKVANSLEGLIANITSMSRKQTASEDTIKTAAALIEADLIERGHVVDPSAELSELLRRNNGSSLEEDIVKAAAQEFLRNVPTDEAALESIADSVLADLESNPEPGSESDAEALVAETISALNGEAR